MSERDWADYEAKRIVTPWSMSGGGDAPEILSRALWNIGSTDKADWVDAVRAAIRGAQ